MSNVGNALAQAVTLPTLGVAGLLPQAQDVIGQAGNALNHAIGSDPFGTQNHFTPNQMQMPTTNEQAGAGYDQSQQALKQQQDFLQAVQAQNGLGNQSQVFGQLQGIANGTGPNPAQAMLNNSTGQNVANQSAMMASQRGASANPALLARQAAMQGANTQQQAAGQGAALQAQQQVGALGQMGQLANQQAAQQQQAQNTALQGAQNQYGQVSQNIANQNNAQAGINSVNANMENAANQRKGNLIGNITGAVGSVFGLAEGGSVPSMPAYQQFMAPQSMAPTTGPQSFAAQHFAGVAAPNAFSLQSNPDSMSEGMKSGAKMGKGIGNALSNFADNQQYKALTNGMDIEGGMQPASNIEGPMAARGGKVPAMVSPGERYLNPQEVEKVAEGKKSPMKAGEKIPGEAKVKGAKNSYANDTVPKDLESGGIVIPRSITQGKDAEKKAHAFISAILQGKQMPKKA